MSMACFSFPSSNSCNESYACCQRVYRRRILPFDMLIRQYLFSSLCCRRERQELLLMTRFRAPLIRQQSPSRTIFSRRHFIGPGTSWHRYATTHGLPAFTDAHARLPFAVKMQKATGRVLRTRIAEQVSNISHSVNDAYDTEPRCHFIDKLSALREKNAMVRFIFFLDMHLSTKISKFLI